jgi:hypothetical protein
VEQAGRAGASMPPRGWWGCSPREEDSGAGSTPEKLAVSRTFFEGVRERGVRWCGDLGLSTGDRSGKAAASARVRFGWGELLARAPACCRAVGRVGWSACLPSEHQSVLERGACWLRVEEIVRALFPCVRLLLFGCCVLADSSSATACGLSVFPVRTPSPGPVSGATSTPVMALH